jgi:hypothetical protein
MRSFITYTLLTQYNQVEESEMGMACSTQGRKEECIESFGGKARRKELLGRET